MAPVDHAMSLCSTETIWNAGLAGTSVARHGGSLTIGEDSEWTSEYLLLLAAESCVMTALIARAREAGIDVLGYVSKGQLDTRGAHGEPPSVRLMPCVVVASDDDAARIERLAHRIPDEAIVATLLGERLRITFDVRAVPGGSAR